MENEGGTRLKELMMDETLLFLVVRERYENSME